VFLVWNVTSTFFSILNILNMPKTLIQLWDYLLCFNGFPFTTPAPQSDPGAESYGSWKLDGS
jgi:hypothetical protein